MATEFEAAKTELQAFMAEIKQEFDHGTEAHDDMAFRDALRPIVWTFNNFIRDDMTSWAMNPDVTIEEGLRVSLEETRNRLQYIRQNRQASVEWATEARDVIKDMANQISALQQGAAIIKISHEGENQSTKNRYADKLPDYTSRISFFGGSAEGSISSVAGPGGGRNDITSGGGRND